MSGPGKGILVRVVVLAVLLAAIWGISKIEFTSSEGKSFRIERADVRVEVRRDASLRVTERLRFDFNGSFSGAYRDIPLAAGVRASNISVSEPSSGERYRPGGSTVIGGFDQPGRFGAEQLRITRDDGGPTAGFRVVWHYRATDEDREFAIAYDITGAAEAYDDVVSIPWAVWGDQWEFWLDELDAEIALGDSDAEPIEGWLNPPSLGTDVERGPGAATANVARVPAGQQTVLQAVFPREAFDSVAGGRVRSGDGLPGIEQDQQRIEDEQSSLSKLGTLLAAAVVPAGLIWTALVALAAAALYLRARERPTTAPEHLPEPPEQDVPPALAYALAHEGDYDDRIVLATLLDLVDRGHYEAKPSPGEDLDLTLSRVEERPQGELTDYERETLDFFDGLLEDGPEEIGRLKDRVPEHSASWRKRWQSLNTALDRAEEGEIGWDVDLVGARFALALIALAGYAGLIVAYFSRTHLFLLPLAFALVGLFVIYALPARYLKRLDPDSRERSARWAAFARWTRDFPRLEDDPPATLKLWRRILVYAVAMGTADRVIESGRIPAPVVEEAHASGLWLVHSGHGGDMTSNFTRSFDGFASGFSSHVAPESSGGGGGGFSGGGGGVSGGGGGGAW